MPILFPTVGVVAILVLGFDDRRTSITIANTHASNIVYWGNQGGISALTGFPINPGATQTFSRLLGDDPTKPIYLISSGAGSLVRVAYEVKR